MGKIRAYALLARLVELRRHLACAGANLSGLFPGSHLFLKCSLHFCIQTGFPELSCYRRICMLGLMLLLDGIL